MTFEVAGLEVGADVKPVCLALQWHKVALLPGFLSTVPLAVNRCRNEGSSNGNHSIQLIFVSWSLY